MLSEGAVSLSRYAWFVEPRSSNRNLDLRTADNATRRSSASASPSASASLAGAAKSARPMGMPRRRFRRDFFDPQRRRPGFGGQLFPTPRPFFGQQVDLPAQCLIITLGKS
jgi:hypothetical protein